MSKPTKRRAPAARTNAKPSLTDKEELSVTVRPAIAQYVRDMHATGLWGASIGETIDRLLCASISDAIARGFIPGRQFGAKP